MYPSVEGLTLPLIKSQHRNLPRGFVSRQAQHAAVATRWGHLHAHHVTHRVVSLSCCWTLSTGVTLMALGAVEKHNIEVRIVPCGLTYFSGHRFRGHVIVEFGLLRFAPPSPGRRLDLLLTPLPAGKPIVIKPGDD